MGTPSNSPDSSWVAYNSTQFWHSLPRDSIRFHRLKAEFLKTEQTRFLQMPITNPGYHLYFWLSSSINRLEVLMTPSSESINLLGKITELREIFYLLDSFQSFSNVRLFATPSTAAHQASLSITNSQSLLKLMSIESVMPSNHLILCHSLLLPPSIFPSITSFPRSQFFASDGQCIGVSALESVLPVNIQNWLISFRIDWLDLLTVQGTLKSLFQRHNLKASILQCSTFFTVQLSHTNMTTGKTIALTRWAFVNKVMSLLSRFVIAFLPRSKNLIISWLQSPSPVILEPKKIKINY